MCTKLKSIVILARFEVVLQCYRLHDAVRYRSAHANVLSKTCKMAGDAVDDLALIMWVTKSISPLFLYLSWCGTLSSQLGVYYNGDSSLAHIRVAHFKNCRS